MGRGDSISTSEAMAYKWIAWRAGKVWTRWHLLPAAAVIPGSVVATVCGKFPGPTLAISPPTYDRRSTPKEACGTCVRRARHWDNPEEAI